MSETWVINESPTSEIDAEVNYTSNLQTFTGITFRFEIDIDVGFYIYGLYSSQESVIPYDSRTGWDSQAYRTVTFETAPTGNLLTWLQANAVKQ